MLRLVQHRPNGAMAYYKSICEVLPRHRLSVQFAWEELGALEAAVAGPAPALERAR